MNERGMEVLVLAVQIKQFTHAIHCANHDCKQAYCQEAKRILLHPIMCTAISCSHCRQVLKVVQYYSTH